MKRYLTILLLAALVAAGGLAVTGCSTDDSRAEELNEDGEKTGAENGEDEEEKKEEEAAPVEVAALGRGEIEAVLSFSTNLEAEREVQVFAEASRRVERLLVEEGDRVGKGQLLVKLQDDEQKTVLAKIRSQHEKARREYDRQKKLFGDELISEQAFNNATYELERLELEIEEAERQLSYTEVRAPIAGTVTQRMVNVGDFVTVNQQLFEIIDFDSIVARVFVPEKELPNLRPGLAARVRSPALGEKVFGGRVDRISPVVDPRSGTVKVTVALPGSGGRMPSGGLMPGMYVDVDLITALRPDALLLPKRALVYDSDQIFVFLLRFAEEGEEGEEGEGERVERMLVTPLLEDERYVEVAAGFNEGDRVVIAGQAGLKDGAAVRRIERPAEGAPAEAPLTEDPAAAGEAESTAEAAGAEA